MLLENIRKIWIIIVWHRIVRADNRKILIYRFQIMYEAVPLIQIINIWNKISSRYIYIYICTYIAYVYIYINYVMNILIGTYGYLLLS